MKQPPALSESFVERVLDVVAEIPTGRVMSYGDVAATLGSRGARVVGQVMARYGSEVPWWRVVRSTGHPPLCHEATALDHYRAEKTPLLGLTHEGALRSGIEDSYRVDLRAARWSPFD